MTPGAAIPPPVPPRPAAPRRRCVRHETREAVARCVDCGGGFCRECVTEHEDRLYCATCFARVVAAAARKPRRVSWKRIRGMVTAAGAMLCLVAGFYLLGRALAAIPADVHDGTLWREAVER
jgi:B-box zinc finger.